MHRDLNLKNIMFRKKDNFSSLVVLNFGLAEFYNKLKLIFKMCGSPGYIAPEILKGIASNSKVDIFSIGVIMYTLLIGKHPFYSEIRNEIMEKN